MRVLTRLATASSLLAVLLFSGSASTTTVSGKDKAWQILHKAIAGGTTDRVTAIGVLGLLPNDPQAVSLATHALDDSDAKVRVAACNALGQMHSKASIADLQKTLADKEMSVVVAAAHALSLLKDDSAYDVYYAILTGQVKDGKGLVGKQLDTLKDPKQLATMGFSEGIGFVPFAGAGWEAFRMLHKTDPSPVRAAAATVLAGDPDPRSGEALVTGTQDGNWIVRVASLEGIAKRGDPQLCNKIETSLYDQNRKVRYTAAAVVIRLSSIKTPPPKAPGGTKRPRKSVPGAAPPTA